MWDPTGWKKHQEKGKQASSTQLPSSQFYYNSQNHSKNRQVMFLIIKSRRSYEYMNKMFD